MKTILITGAGGRVGSILRNGLKEKYNLKYLVRKPIDEQNFFTGDTRYLEQILPAFKSIDAVIHLAGQDNPDASWDDVFDNNVKGMTNVLEACRLNKVKKLVFASSIWVTRGYEDEIDKTGIITTNLPPKPTTPYGMSKYLSEMLAKFYSENFNISIIILRFSAILDTDDVEKLNFDKVTLERRLSSWIHHEDLIQLVERAIESNIKFGIYFGNSNNAKSLWDISTVIKELGYTPKYNAEEHFKHLIEKFKINKV